MTKKKATVTKKTTKQAPASIPLANLFKAACAPENAERAAAVMEGFPRGTYTGAIKANLRDGTPDIRSLLYHLAATYKPAVYLEVGVRLGYSLAMVASASPDTAIIGVDSWIPNYGGEPNGSPETVEAQLGAMGYKNRIELISQDSSLVLPNWRGPKIDLILLDAAHTAEGVLSDLRACLPHLAPGGFLVLDDLDRDPGSAWQTIQKEAPELEYHAEGIVGLAYRREG
jgi:predicted O-methyltransferase YrrM